MSYALCNFATIGWAALYAARVTVSAAAEAVTEACGA